MIYCNTDVTVNYSRLLLHSIFLMHLIPFNVNTNERHINQLFLLFTSMFPYHGKSQFIYHAHESSLYYRIWFHRCILKLIASQLLVLFIPFAYEHGNFCFSYDIITDTSENGPFNFSQSSCSHHNHFCRLLFCNC